MENGVTRIKISLSRLSNVHSNMDSGDPRGKTLREVTGVIREVEGENQTVQKKKSE